MKTISILNLKAGVTKTITFINMAHILATEYNKRALLIDNDKQGNSSKFFKLHNYEMPGRAEFGHISDGVEWWQKVNSV